ncbi:LMBR1-like membrane protein-domain-containing protein [Dendryphion nanum]|uniref:LMBR1-like membrane protein-domain-containing protein n=1 Tax=Dendryphion nanum TaxID=256645 RepID=A0A9P9EEG2_9PLEO|nr:LMBR1-like membrane protein-domain-containing protein [Dendryphion nanum]
MTSSPAGSTAFFALSLLAICGLVLLLLRYYLPLRSTPAYVTLPVFLAIALPASIVLLVPIDLASSAGTDTDGSRGIWLPDKVVFKSWRIMYWLTFALTWIMLPYLGEYCDSGYREPKARVLYAFRSNGRYQLMMLGAGILGAIYYVLQNGFHFESFKGMIMALAYLWGLVLAIYLMGHGLVAFPRTLYRHASISGRLKKLQSHAPKINDKLTEALDKLDQYEDQVVQLKQRKNGVSRDFQEWIEDLSEGGNTHERRAGAPARRGETIPPVITERYLADLTRKLKRARHAKTRFSNEWDDLVRKAVETQAILDSKASKRLEFKNLAFHVPQTGFLSKYPLLTPYTRYHLHVHVIPVIYYIASFITSLASVSIVWSECIRSLEPKLSLIGLTVIHHPTSSRGQIGFGGQLIAAAWLCYMCICAFFSLTEVKIWGNRALVKRGTYQESATWYGLQVAKLTVPLAYNFVTFTPPTIYKDTSFHKFLGKYIVLTPLGEGFSSYFPVFILVPVLASLFGLYKRIKTICGFGDLLEDEDDSEEGAIGTGSWREGRALIDREIQSTSGNALGLSSRGGVASPPGERYTDTPSSTSTTNAEESSSRTQRDRERRRPQIIDEEENGNFFTDFADRVKNTFDSTDFTFTRPKWMGGDEDEPSNASGSNDRNEGWRSLFGGRSDEGRVRL